MRSSLDDAARWQKLLLEIAVACGKQLCIYVKKIDFDKELSFNSTIAR